jgi:hypothetical protein
MINGNFINFLNFLGVMKGNSPQQTVMALLQQGLNSGKINQQQYNAMTSGLQNGANPNTLIQQLMGTGVVNQQDYELAKQGISNLQNNR